MSDRRVVPARPLIVALALLLASCKSATEVCPSDDPLCNGNGGPTPSLSISDVIVTEGHEGTVAAGFTVTLSASSTQTVTVNYATSDATATAPDDYTGTAGLLSFSPGTTSQTISVAVRGDIADEGTEETFTVTLTSPSNATLGDASATGTIVDDDDCSSRGTLTPGMAASESLTPGDCQIAVDLYVDIWTLEMANQEGVQIDQSSVDFDTYLELYDDQGNLVADDDDSGGGVHGTDSQIVVFLSAGTYFIFASSFAFGETGNYQLSVDTPVLAPMSLSRTSAPRR